MDYNCFACSGTNRKCEDERKYVPYGDDDTCIYRSIAKRDLAKLSIGEIRTITLKSMLAEYLKDNEDSRFLKILSYMI
jgi:hypothetical protein